MCQIQSKNLKMPINFIFVLCILEIHFEETSNVYPGRLMLKYKREDVENRTSCISLIRVIKELKNCRKRVTGTDDRKKVTCEEKHTS